MNLAANHGVFLAGILFLFGTITWVDASENGHLADSNCQECHLAAKVEDPAKARMLIGNQEKLCVRCHPKAVQLSHPSGFAPGRSLPATFPLDWKGDLTCASCHQIHGNTPGLMRGSSKGFALCRDCHDEKFFAKQSGRGSSMARYMHLEVKNAPATNALDDSSRQCLVCHDDKGGNTKNRVGLDSRGVMRHMHSSLSHPIGRQYAQLGDYQPLASLPKKILLPDGKVGCVSCHEGTGTSPGGMTTNNKGSGMPHGGLTVDNQGSALCATCHIQ